MITASISSGVDQISYVRGVRFQRGDSPVLTRRVKGSVTVALSAIDKSRTLATARFTDGLLQRAALSRLARCKITHCILDESTSPSLPSDDHLIISSGVIRWPSVWSCCGVIDVAASR